MMHNDFSPALAMHAGSFSCNNVRSVGLTHQFGLLKSLMNFPLGVASSFCSSQCELSKDSQFGKRSTNFWRRLAPSLQLRVGI